MKTLIEGIQFTTQDIYKTIIGYTVRMNVSLVYIFNSQWICMFRTWHSFRTMPSKPCVMMHPILTVSPYEYFKLKACLEKGMIGQILENLGMWRNELEIKENASQRQCLLHKDYGLEWVAFYFL